MKRAIALALITLAAPAIAEPSGKFTVQGSVLLYNSDNATDDSDAEVSNGDVDELLELLQSNPSLTSLHLTSGGGSVWAGNEMARIVEDFELNTHAVGECSSSCVTVFLAGDTRTMERGSKIGFHQRSWSAGAIQGYYERWREDEGWDTPYDFASWVYEDTQTEIYKELSYMIARGVDPAFAIETKRLRATMWFPTRRELTSAGILRETGMGDVDRN